jgi:hypothetical protein
MIVAIMQPYFFPYFGYFQLIDHADIFVIHDDVQYIKRGWVNRNLIPLNGRLRWLTMPVRRASSKIPINKRLYQLTARNATKALRRIEAAYLRAPYFRETFPFIAELMSSDDENVALYNENVLRRVAARLEIRTRFIRSSELDKDDQLAGEERVIDICQRLGATRYVNPIGGMKLYQCARFERAGIEISFIQPRRIDDTRWPANPGQPASIIDTLMYTNRAAVQPLLQGAAWRSYAVRSPGILLPKVLPATT